MRGILLGLSIFLFASFILVVLGLFSFGEWYRRYEHSAKEKSERVDVLRQAFFTITWHNVKYYMGQVTYKMDKTPLSKMNETEYSSILRPVPTKLYYVTKVIEQKASVPIAVDWRKTGLLPEGTLDNEWLNSSSSSLVVQWALEMRPLLERDLLRELAQTELEHCTQRSSLESMLDCADTTDIRKLDESFADRGTLQKEKLRERADKKLVQFADSTESSLHQAVSKGPVMAAIHATPNFRHYKSGVFFDPSCRDDEVNYAVLIVGYGTDEDFGDYWLVKTTWGSDFGENGYARVARNRDNHCGIALFAYWDIYRHRVKDHMPLIWNYYASEYKTGARKFGALKAGTLHRIENLFWVQQAMKSF